MRAPSRFAAALLFIMPAFTASSAARSDELRVASSVAVRSVMERLAPLFHMSTGDKLVFEFATASALQKRISEAPDAFDVSILTPAATRNLVTAGYLAAESVTDIGRAGVGVAVRSGAAKPALSSSAELLTALLSAKSISYASDGASGAYFIKLLTSRGVDIAALKLIPVAGSSPLDLVATGQAELGIQLISEIKAAKGVDLAGEFPKDVQDYTVMTAAIGEHTKMRNSGIRFLGFLHSPQTRSLMRQYGLEPIE